MDNKSRVLIIDDDKDIHDILNMALDSINRDEKKSLRKSLLEELSVNSSSKSPLIDIFHAYQGEEAISLLRDDSQPAMDLLVLDMLMPPGINGAEVMKELSKTSKDLKIIISTAYFHDLEDQIREMAQHFNSVYLLMKPFNLNIFVDLVTGVLSEKESDLNSKDILKLK